MERPTHVLVRCVNHAGNTAMPDLGLSFDSCGTGRFSDYQLGRDKFHDRSSALTGRQLDLLEQERASPLHELYRILLDCRERRMKLSAEVEVVETRH